MINLTTTSDLIRVVTDAAVTVDVHASWVDLLTAVATPGRTNSAISTATTTTIVGSPAASTQRNAKTISIRNRHASSSVGVTVEFFDGTTAFQLHKVILLAGEMLLYQAQAEGWVVFDANGQEKINTPTIITRTLASDQSNSTTTPTEVTGLKLTGIGPGVYQFWYMIVYRAAATTTGVRFSVNHDGTVTSFVANARWVDASATASTAAPTQAGVGAAGQVVGAMSARAKSTAGWGTTISVDAADSDMLMIVEGTFNVSVSGELELWHGSEVAAASTVRGGSSVVCMKVG